MSSKFAISLLGLTVAAAVAAVGISVYTARKLDEQIQKTIEQVNTSHVVRASWYLTSSLPFSRNGVLHLVFLNERMRENAKAAPVINNDPESLQRVQEEMAEPLTEESRKPVELYINISNTTFPFIVKGTASLDMMRGTPGDLVKRKELPATLPMTLSWQYIAPNQDFGMRLSMDSWKIAQPDQDVSVGAAEFSLKGDLSDALELNYAWDGFKANGRYNGHNTVEIMPLDGSSLLRNFSGIWISPEGHMRLAGMKASASDGKFDMGELQFNSVMDEVVTETGTMLNMKHKLVLNKLALHSAQDQFDVEDLQLGVNFTGLNKQGLEELAAQMQAKQPDFMQMMKSLNKITTRTMRVELAPFRMKLNKAMVTATGKLETLPFEVEQVMQAAAAHTPDPFKYMIQGDLNFSAEMNAIQALPADVQQQLDVLQKQGYVKIDNKGLSSNMLLRGGVVTANGKIVDIEPTQMQEEE